PSPHPACRLHSSSRSRANPAAPPFPTRRSSDLTMRACAGILGLEYEVFHREWVEIYPQRVRGEFSSLAEGFDYVARRLGTAASEDRKSTRLNSSHVKVSYAVSCCTQKTRNAHHG